MLNVIAAFARRRRFQFAPAKTKVMVVGPPRRAAATPAGRRDASLLPCALTSECGAKALDWLRVTAPMTTSSIHARGRNSIVCACVASLIRTGELGALDEIVLCDVLLRHPGMSCNTSALCRVPCSSVPSVRSAASARCATSHSLSLSSPLAAPTDSASRCPV